MPIVLTILIRDNIVQKMEYYRSNITGAIASSNPTDISNNLFNSASDSYASNYWNVPYSDGLSPMKQIEGKIFFSKTKRP